MPQAEQTHGALRWVTGWSRPPCRALRKKSDEPWSVGPIAPGRTLFPQCLGAVSPPILLYDLLLSFMKGSFTHPSAPVRIPFQLSEHSKPCKTRELIIIIMIVITVIIASIFCLFTRYYATVSHELSQSIFLTTPGGRYYCYSYFQMRRLGPGWVASMVR